MMVQIYTVIKILNFTIVGFVYIYNQSDGSFHQIVSLIHWRNFGQHFKAFSNS